MIDDASVSKIHASLVLNAENQLMVADTGSTNGTFINGQRIAYGKAFMINDGDMVKFGTVEVVFRRVPRPVEFETRDAYETESFKTENQQVVIKPQAVESPQTAVQESFKQTLAPEQKAPPAEIYKTSENADIYKTGENYAGGNGAENVRNNETDSDAASPNSQNESRVFETRQGIKLNFGDDNNNSSDNNGK